MLLFHINNTIQHRGRDLVWGSVWRAQESLGVLYVWILLFLCRCDSYRVLEKPQVGWMDFSRWEQFWYISHYWFCCWLWLKKANRVRTITWLFHCCWTTFLYCSAFITFTRYIIQLKMDLGISGWLLCMCSEFILDKIPAGCMCVCFLCGFWVCLKPSMMR